MKNPGLVVRLFKTVQREKEMGKQQQQKPTEKFLFVWCLIHSSSRQRMGQNIETARIWRKSFPFFLWEGLLLYLFPGVEF